MASHSALKSARSQASKTRSRDKTRPTEESDVIRRDRNRRAQQAFRARRQAVQEDNARYIRTLESTVEKMSGILVAFADEILQSHAASFDVNLAEKLQISLQSTLSLANATVGSKPGEQSETDLAQMTLPTPPCPITETNARPDTAGAHQQESPSSTLKDAPLDADIQAFAGDTTEQLHPVISSESNFDEHRTAPSVSNVFGNGWTGHLPFPYAISAPKTADRSARDSLGRKIVHFSLFRAYQILLDASHLSTGPVNWHFAFSLRMHSRQELLFNLRWFLGPGQSEIHLLARAAFQVLPAPVTTHPPILHPIVNLGVLGEESFDAAQLNAPRLFLNADDVVAYLDGKGVQRIDANTLELPIDTTTEIKDIASQTRSVFPNGDVFFPSSQEGGLQKDASVKAAARRIRISESALLHHLAGTSACLAYGPGYRTESLDKAILDSIVQ